MFYNSAAWLKQRYPRFLRVAARCEPKLMRYGIAIFGFLAFAFALAAQKPNITEHVIDLKAIGYPESPCDYMFQVNSYAKTHVEFLDSERLLVSFPAHTSACDEKHGYPLNQFPRAFRSVVMDTTGKVLHSLEWNSEENVQAGPGGHILLLTGKDIRILDADFSFLQNIQGIRPLPIRAPAMDPSRRGFVLQYGYPIYRVAYFEGNPARQTQEAEDCDRVVVVDGGFVCLDDSEPQGFAPHVSKDPSQLTLRMIHSIATREATEIPDKHWLLPGWPAWHSRFAMSPSASAQRVLYFSTGCLFPISDTNGFGYYFRVAVVDFEENRTIFRKQYDIGSDVAISPDGKWLAVREKTRLTIHKL